MKNNIISLLSMSVFLAGCEVVSNPLVKNAGTSIEEKECYIDNRCSLVVGWDKNDADEQVDKYVVHYGTTSRYSPSFAGYDHTANAGSGDNVRLRGLGNETYYMSVTAHRGSGVSDFSEEISVSLEEIMALKK